MNCVECNEQEFDQDLYCLHCGRRNYHQHKKDLSRHSFTIAWQPINFGIVIDFRDKYIAVGLIFFTYRYNA